MLFGCAANTKDYSLVAEAGYDYAELPCRVISGMENREFSEFFKEFEKCLLPVAAMNIYCPPEVVIAGPGYDLNTAKAYARKASARAKDLGVAVVGIGSPRSRSLPQGFDRAAAVRQASDFLIATADVFGAKGITVCFEALGACYCNFVNSFPEAVEIVSDIGHDMLKVVLDLYNMEHAGEADVEYANLTSFIAHAHISDDAGTPSKRSCLLTDKYHVHAERLRRLTGYGYDKRLTLEIDLPVDVEMVRESLAFMKNACFIP